MLIQTVSQNRLVVGGKALAALDANPTEPVEGRVGKTRFQARVGIPGYVANVARHYADLLPGDIGDVCKSVGLDPPFQNFGLICAFDNPTELQIHDSDLNLDTRIRELIDRFGPIILTNAYLPEKDRKADQNNIFPHLQFHFDRGPNQPTQISLFYRDPFDPIQTTPRESSTVHCANIVAHLQFAKEEKKVPQAIAWRGFYNIYGEEDTNGLLGDILLEHRWDAPQGSGEIAVLFNGTILHASYYRKTALKGWPISVRYLR